MGDDLIRDFRIRDSGNLLLTRHYHIVRKIAHREARLVFREVLSSAEGTRPTSRKQTAALKGSAILRTM